MDSNNQNSNNSNRNRRNRNNKKKFSPAGAAASPQGVRPPKKKPHNRRPGAQAQSNNDPNDPQAKKRPQGPSRNRRPPQRRKTGGAPGAGSSVVRKYEHFMEMYLNTRKKFFSVFFVSDIKQKNKSKKNYETAIKQLREFEDNLPEDQQKQYDEHIIIYPDDNKISVSMEESGEIDDWKAEIVANKDPEGFDPHELATQRDTAYMGDTEESVATEFDITSFSRSRD